MNAIIIGFATEEDLEALCQIDYEFHEFHVRSIPDRLKSLGEAEDQDWAKNKAASEMRLDIWEFPQGPLYFYQNQGYRTLKRTLVRDL